MKAHLSICVAVCLSGCGTALDPKHKEPAVATPTSSSEIYAVQPGDTGMKIAMKHDLMIADLVAMNPDVDWARLKVGQMIKIRNEN